MHVFMPIAVGCLMIGLFMLLFTEKSRRQKRIDATPIMTCAGIVKEKYMRIVPLYKSSMSVSHFIFEAEDGQRLALEIKDEWYGQISEGDKGVLSYRMYNKANYFVGFELNR